MSVSDADMVEFREATTGDLPAIVELLRDDDLAQERETGPMDRYREAFARIEAHPGQHFYVGVFQRQVVCCAQLSLLPGLSHNGATRAQIESVRVAARLRGRGIGHAVIGFCVEAARGAGADLVQLRTDARRVEARRFYEELGFEASHHGLTRWLVPKRESGQ